MTRTTMNISKKLVNDVDMALDFFNNSLVTTGLFDDPDTGIDAIGRFFHSKGAARTKLILTAVFMAAPLAAAGGIVIPDRDDVIAMIKPAKRAIKAHRMFVHVVNFDHDHWPSTDKISDGWMGHPVVSVRVTR